MATAIQDHVKELNKLIHLDHDAVAAYGAAIERLDEPRYKTQLTQFKGDHERHIRDLTALVRELGGDPAEGGDFKKVLTQGKVVIGNITGDKGILQAMKSNEEETNHKYERALSVEGLPPRVRELLARNLEDERRHRAWLIEQLERI